MVTTSLLLGTKTAVPRLPTLWVRRARLNDRCAIQGREVLLVAAFAGSGKTMLLADWMSHDCEAAERAWITLDARDNAAGRLASLIAHALGVDVVEHETDGRARSDTALLDRAFEAVVERAGETVLVLDDVHELTSKAAMRALAHLVAHLPANLALVLATRADPPIPLSRLQIEGRLRQLRTRDLALTRDESVELFDRHGVTLKPADLDSLRSRTGGWVGGMRLAAIALADEHDRALFVEHAVHTDGMISDYLVHEVLDRQPPELQRFLLRTSVAQSLTSDLARVLSDDPDTDERLADLERSGVFVTQIDDATPTYRFHALFGELLRARLLHEEPELAVALMSRAAAWYLAHDMPIEAELHAFRAGDIALGGALSCRRWVRDQLYGTPTTVIDVSVPEATWSTAPELALLAAASATARGDRRNAVMWRARLDALRPRESTDQWFDVGRSLLDVMFGRAFGTDARARAACRTLMNTEFGPETRRLHALVRLREAELLLDTDDDEGTLRSLLDARWRASRNAAMWAVDECDVVLALVAAVRGRLDSCETLLAGVPWDDHDSQIDARRLAVALCDAQRGKTSTARSTLREAPISPRAARAVRVGIEEALARLDVPGPGPAPTAHRSDAMAAGVRIALGSLEGPDAPRLEAAVASARRLLARQRDDLLLEVLEPSGCARDVHSHLRTRVEALILMAIAADHLGRQAVALASLQGALELAGPPDLRAPFLAHAAAIGVVLDRYSWQLTSGTRYAVELVDDLHPEELPTYLEPLTSRERAVLEYLPTMMTNTEIAHQLLVSVNTVKTHLKSVYRKLGVDRRRDAVARARQFELL